MIILSKLVLSTIRENLRILLSTIVTIWTVLTFLGVLTLTYKNLTGAFEKLFEVRKISVLVRSDISPENRQDLESRIRKISGNSGMEFLKGSKVKNQLKDSLKDLEEELNALPEDFFPAAIVFQTPIRNEQTDQALSEIEKLPYVETILNSFRYNNSVNRLFETLDLFGFLLIVLLLVSLYLIAGNSIRLMIYGQIKEIEIFLLFGARAIFILKPVMIQITGVAIIAYFLSVATVYLIYHMILRGVDLILTEYSVTKLVSFFTPGEIMLWGLVLIAVCLLGSTFVFFRTLSKLEF